MKGLKKGGFINHGSGTLCVHGSVGVHPASEGLLSKFPLPDLKNSMAVALMDEHRYEETPCRETDGSSRVWLSKMSECLSWRLLLFIVRGGAQCSSHHTASTASWSLPMI